MSQLPRTTNDLIVNSLFLLGELGVDEQPDSFMLSTGLFIINALLAQFSANSVYIAFIEDLSFTMVVGKDVYSVSDIVTSDLTYDRIVSLEYATFSVEVTGPTIVYPLKIINKSEYYNTVRLSNLLARPGFVFLNKQIQQSFITFYPVPDQPYPCDLKVKFMIDQLTADQDVTNIPTYYQWFLVYAMARTFKEYYPSGNWTQTAEDEYQRMLADLKVSNETDMTIRTSAILETPRPFYWPNILAY